MNYTDMKFPPFTYTIEKGKIIEFCKAIGDDNPIYFDIEAAKENGYRDIPIPPTFATVMEMWAGSDFDALIKKLQLNPLKVLHGEQSYEYFGEICANDTLFAQTTCIAAAERRGMKLITLETVFRNENQEIVLVAKSTIIEQP
ncbi:MaoC family dehydratase N-terminal domain-containing protein [Microbacteriaceae bacterium 4G12]